MTVRLDQCLGNASFTLLASCAGLVVSLALAAAWLLGGLLGLSSLIERGLLLAVMLALAGGLQFAVWQCFQATQKRAIRSIRLLCQTNYLELAEQPAAEQVDRRLSPEWRSALEQLSSQMLEYAGRLKESEHARARAELKSKRIHHEHRQMRQILNSLQDPVLAINGFNEINFANESASRLFHLPAESAETQAESSLLRCEELVHLLIDKSQHRAQTARCAEVQIADDGGAESWYRIRCCSLPGDDGEPQSAGMGAVAVLRDINEQKTIQRRNAEFVSAVSHEMKTPLTGIKAYVELLADGDAEDEETREEFLGVINSQADRLQRLIDNMLDLARIEAGVVQVSKQQISLNEVLEQALEVVAPSAEQKSLQLQNELSPMYLGVLADRDMMLQAAINLLSNAIKYTPEGGAVTLRSQMLGSDIAFEVQDTGVGLSPDDCHRVFEKFYRVKKDKQMAAGTGLGLPLAKHIVEDVHGGRLEVQSEEGAGSTFRITLTEQRSAPALV